ncbi:hypothetical protein JTE90_019988 [Oedothorax gibbosus]|uniref:Cryptochrome/DNA photolyase FAD-binding domain-containing protein n=1 Tax=Oedothorax gibbosus TaxID=931172 RepID=A0AAV6U212_9ARAC|nr:hypothetical protein JTE90_019988 [Oedothorax gibbosus]
MAENHWDIPKPEDILPDFEDEVISEDDGYELDDYEPSTIQSYTMDENNWIEYLLPTNEDILENDTKLFTNQSNMSIPTIVEDFIFEDSDFEAMMAEEERLYKERWRKERLRKEILRKVRLPEFPDLSGFDTENLKPSVWIGGETEALSRFERHLERKAWVASFGRPKMTLQSFLLSQTGLSPYLRFGCLSPRLFYQELTELYRKVFDELLLDADWSVNAGQWMCLSCSSFFQQFFRLFCPLRFGRKADPNGGYIRKYLPVLRNFPTKYIHKPWTAPEKIQIAAKCIIRKDYVIPMVNHQEVSHINLERMKQVYQQLSHYKGTNKRNSTYLLGDNKEEGNPKSAKRQCVEFPQNHDDAENRRSGTSVIQRIL